MFVFLQIIVFMCYGIMLNKWVLQTYQPDFMKSPLVYHPGHRAQVWRFFSYMFMHVGYEPQPQRTVKSVEAVADVTQQSEKQICRQYECFSLSVLPPFSLEQLGFNALLQLMIGVPLEMVHGILRISLLYMAGVLAGRCLLKKTNSVIWELLLNILSVVS